MFDENCEELRRRSWTSIRWKIAREKPTKVEVRHPRVETGTKKQEIADTQKVKTVGQESSLGSEHCSGSKACRKARWRKRRSSSKE